MQELHEKIRAVLQQQCPRRLCRGHCSQARSMTAVLVAFLLLFQGKQPLRVGLFPFPALCLALLLALLLLQFQRLLGFRPDSGVLQLLPDVPLPPFGIPCVLFDAGRYSGAEPQAGIVFQNPFIDLGVLSFARCSTNAATASKSSWLTMAS